MLVREMEAISLTRLRDSLWRVVAVFVVGPERVEVDKSVSGSWRGS